MKLNARLKKVADFVPSGANVMDIGCDHALLDIYLVQTKKSSFCLASDIGEGPLAAAKKNIEKYQVQKNVKTMVGDGLDTYDEKCNTIVISGLGGKTIQGILVRGNTKLKTIDTIILSPNNYQKDIKTFLCKKGYYIADEEFVKENKIIYQIIKFAKGRKKYRKKDLFFGPILLQKKGPLFSEFYQRELKSREILLALLPKSYRMKRFQTEREIKMIKEVLKDS